MIAPRFVLAAVAASLLASLALPVLAQEGGSKEDQQQQEEEHQKEVNSEFNTNAPGMPKLKNAGPCPYVKTLYDAARYIEFKDGREASAAVEYSGEIENLAAGCAYKGAQPIEVRIQALMAFGRGPQATSSRKDFPYWIAVTDRNRAVLAKESFDLPVVFPAGQDRVSLTVNLPAVTIPRADAQVSGSNFEILIGFQVTPEMADFNRLGKRFLADAGQTGASAARTPASPQ